MSLPAPISYALCRPSDDATYTLKVIEYAPDPVIHPGPTYPFVAVIHGGNWKSGAPSSPDVTMGCEDLRAQGYIAVALSYRLVGSTKAGQSTTGRWPQSVNDIKLALKCLRLDSRCNGQVGVIGGSAGAHLASVCAIDTTQDLATAGVDRNNNPVAKWTAADRPDFAVALSGIYNFADRTPVDYTPDPYPVFKNTLYAYTGTSSDSAPDLAIMLADSPVTGVVSSDIKPLSMFQSEQEQIPFPQIGLMVAKLNSVGLTTFRSRVLAGTNHQWEYWGNDNGAGQTVRDEVLAWIADILAGGSGGGTPPPGGLPKGLIPGIGAGTTIDQVLLDSNSIDGFGLNVNWADLEPTEGNFAWTSLVQPIQRAAAAGKNIHLIITTMGGSRFYKGNTPNWVFDKMGADPGDWQSGQNRWRRFPGDMTTFDDFGTTNASPTVLSRKAYFTAADVGRAISGPNIPANSYIGIVNVLGGDTIQGSIGLSSSPTSNVPVNATGTGTVTLVIAGRPVVAKDSHDWVWGRNFTYLDQNENHTGDPLTTIPVFWDPVYCGAKLNMLNAVGEWLTNGTDLTSTEKQRVRVFHVSFANAQTEDWNFPADTTVDIEGQLTPFDRWVLPFNDNDETQRGNSYVTDRLSRTAQVGGKAGPNFGQDVYLKATGTTASDIITVAGVDVAASAPFVPLQGMTYADVSQAIANNTYLPKNTTIIKWISKTQVQLSANPIANFTDQLLHMTGRVTGFFDVAIAAGPNQIIALAYHRQQTGLDDQAASDAGYTGSARNYVPDLAVTNTQTRYPGKIIGQYNAIKATTALPPPGDNGELTLLYDWHTRGIHVAGQAAWFCFQDPSFRMNGGDNTDKRNAGQTLTDGQIWLRSGQNLAAYGALYYEVYRQDALNLTDEARQLHDIFNPDGGGGGGGGGDAELPPSLPPIQLDFNPMAYWQVIQNIAGRLLIDSDDISPGRAQRWTQKVNDYLADVWQLHKWPAFLLTEERAFRPIWRPDIAPAIGDEFYFLGELDTDNTTIINKGYYQCYNSSEAKGVHPSDPAFYDPLILTTNDYYLPLLQDCRRRLGEIDQVYPSDPRVATQPPPPPLPWQLSRRGLEIFRFGGETVFVRYRAVPYLYSAETWTTGQQFLALDLTLYPGDGHVYRATETVAGVPPIPASLTWARVPFPRFLAPYVTNLVAADEAPDAASRLWFTNQAEEFLSRLEDQLLEQGVRPLRYRLTPLRRTQALYGQVTTSTATDAPNTISDICVNEWGDIIPS